MSDLIEKLKQADGASRELDNDVWEFLGQGVVQHPWGKEHRYAPPISSSIDAALALVGEVLPGWLRSVEEYYVHNDPQQGVGGWEAAVMKPGMTNGLATHKSPAIAILIALLEALSAKEKG